MRSNRGFSLFELLIVVAIMLIIATIAIPALVRSRQAADESAAVASLRLINTAEMTYLTTASGSYGALTDLVSAGLLDSRFSSSGTISGYNFPVSASGSNYTATAIPSSPNSGRYAYYSLPDAVIHYSTTTDATHCGGVGGNCYPGTQSGQPVQ